ncbi:DnaE-like DNA polymerase III alpha [Mycobacterium phage Leopard]|nr:DnaE-like DNA polymerase III alpha [Mycobacterium phage Leopard]
MEFCATAGMKAMALTEHGNVSSHVQLEKAALKFGIKPIFGLEGYIAPPNQKRKCHQTILAMSSAGYSNLNKMVVESWKTLGTTSKSRFPTIHLEVLEEYSDGIIILSGCADSVLSCTLLGGKSYGDPRLTYDRDDYRRAVGVVEWYQEIFGDRYYIETQRFPQLDRTRALNPAFERLSRDTGVPLAATSDCHYVYARDNEMQKILHAAHRGSSVQAMEASWEYDCTLDIPGDDERVLRDLLATGLSEEAATEALLNTGRIADRCEVKLQKVEPIKYVPDEKDWEPWAKQTSTR